MNKKILAVLAVLLVSVCALCACKGLTVLDKYEGVKDAKTVVQVIEVTNGGAEFAKETLTYNFASGKVTIEKKVLNDSSASEAFTTTTETKDITRGEGIVNLKGLTMSGVVTTDDTFRGEVANADLKTAFGVDGAKVKGGATVELLADGDKVVKMIVSYVSSNDNNVVITSTFTY